MFGYFLILEQITIVFKSYKPVENLYSSKKGMFILKLGKTQVEKYNNKETNENNSKKILKFFI